MASWKGWPLKGSHSEWLKNPELRFATGHGGWKFHKDIPTKWWVFHGEEIHGDRIRKVKTSPDVYTSPETNMNLSI